MNHYEYMSFYNVCKYEDSLWVNNIVTNDLYRLDEKTLEILEIVDLKLDEYADKIYPQYFIQMVKHGDSLYLFPSKSIGKILIYNLDTKEIQCQGLGLEDICREDTELFFEGIQYADCFWIFPSSLDIPLLIYDLGNEKISYNWKWNEKLRFLLGRNVSFSLYVAHCANFVYIFQKEAPKIIATDLESGSVEIISLQSDGKICSMAVDEVYLWIIMEQDNCLYRYNRTDTYEWAVFSLIEQMEVQQNIPHHRIIDMKDKIIALPFVSNIKSIYIFDKKTESARKIPEECFPANLCSLKDFRKGLECYWGYSVIEKELILYPCSANMMLVINVDDITVKGYSTYRYGEKLGDYIAKKFQEIEYRKETESEDLLVNRYGLQIIKNILSESEKRNR